MNEIEIFGAIIKPREAARRLRKKHPSIDSEWDFSHCPPKETSECLFWEYAREIPSIRQWVKMLRSSCDETTFDGFYRAYHSQTISMWDLNKLPRVFAGKFYFAPEWPAASYLSTDSNERRRRLNNSNTAGKVSNFVHQDIFQAWPVFAKHYLERDFFEALERVIRETGKATIHYGTGSTDAIFSIPWHCSDIILKREFADWLKKNRPKGIPATRRGEGQSTVKQHQTALRHLAAWRLLVKHRLDWATAEELTRTGKKGEPLYSGQDNWLAAKRDAENRLQGMANFAAGR